MTAAKLNLTIHAGITFGPVIFRCRDANDAPVNLTGWSAQAQGRNKGELIIDFAPAITNAPNGEVTIAKIPDETTEDLPLGNFNWDLVLQSPTPDLDRSGPFVSGALYIRSVQTQRP